MKAKDTVMSKEKIEDIYATEEALGVSVTDYMKATAKAQAELSFRAGIREVIEWNKQNSDQLLIDAGLFHIVTTTKKWYAKLKEWGIK